MIKLSAAVIRNRKTQVDNIFISEYMPYAPESYVKVYLYGLFLGANGGDDMTIDKMAAFLNTEPSVIAEAFAYWNDQELIDILSTEPLSVEYLEVKPLSHKIKKFSKDKYKTFNDQLHAMLPNRAFLPAEYNEYYNAIEYFHINPDAMLAIIAYCVRLKGDTIGYPYIIAVARNLASHNCTTFERVNERLNELALYSSEILPVLKALGSRKQPDHNDCQEYLKWTKTFGFAPEVVIAVAKDIKKGGMEKLNAKLTRYYENHVFTKAEIDGYNAGRDKLFSLTKEINRILGIYIEQLDYTIETYITKWLSYGFDDKTLITLAKYCYSHDVRALSGMDEVVKRFYKQGLLTEESIGLHISEAIKVEQSIKSILSKAGSMRTVTGWDRDYYRTWTFSWGFTQEVIEYAATLAAGKGNVCAYINSILADWHKKGVNTLSQAQSQNTVGAIKKEDAVITSKSAEELNALFSHLDPEDI